MEPNEIIGGGPFRLYYAPVGSAEPALEDDHDTIVAGGVFTYLGYLSDNGITVSHPQTLNPVRVLEHRAPVKMLAAEEGLEIEATVLGLSAAKYAAILNDLSVSQVAPGTGTVGYKEFGLYRGFTIAEFAVLFRWPSPEFAGGVAQFFIPRAVPSGEPSPVFQKGEPAGLTVRFTAILDLSQPDAKMLGWVKVQDAAAL